jgi:hypothetical protein
MIIENPEDYTHIGFEKSNTKYKKYDALLKNRENGKIKRVPFGNTLYKSYTDRTGLNLYEATGDKERRRLYRLRHKGEDKNKFSSGYFALKYLW